MPHRSFLAKTKTIFIEGDTNTIRVLLAVASLIFALDLWAPYPIFLRPYWQPLAAVASQTGWGLAFFLHFILVMWRQYDDTPRPLTAFLINAYGLLLWFVVTGMLTQGTGNFAPTNSLELTVLLAGAVALVRTGLNDEKHSP